MQSIDTLDFEALLNIARFAAERAGSYLLTVRSETMESAFKVDGSPVSEADIRSNSVIREILSETEIDVISEESHNRLPPVDCYWLVDPLDGTKEFLRGDPYFTVNIALMVESRPLIGVIFAPALDEEHFALNLGSLTRETLNVLSSPDEEVRIVCSESHPEGEVALFEGSSRPLNVCLMGSAIKFARVSEGAASIYPRLAGSSEWDTAAGQALIEATGGAVLEWPTLSPLTYGKPRHRNPGFIAHGRGCDVKDFLSVEALKQVTQ